MLATQPGRWLAAWTCLVAIVVGACGSEPATITDVADPVETADSTPSVLATSAPTDVAPADDLAQPQPSAATQPSAAAEQPTNDGDISGSVNAYFLGHRINAGDDLDDNPCDERHEDGPSERAYEIAGQLIEIVDIAVQSTRACDRVVIELGEQAGPGEPSKSIALFPSEHVVSSSLTDEEVEIVFSEAMAEWFGSFPPVRTWADIATGETNAALQLDRDYGPTVWAGWGTGTAAVRYLDRPARIVIDVFQAPTPPGYVAGPVGNSEFGGPILLEPLQRELRSAGISAPITMRGRSFGFEGTSVIEIRPWSQQPDSVPSAWNGVLFGTAPPGPILPAFAEWGDSGPWPIQARGYFELSLDGLPPGGWQIAVTASNPVGCWFRAVGQQFRIADQSLQGVPTMRAEPFTVAPDFGGVVPGENTEVPFDTVITVRGENFSTPSKC